MILNNQDGTFDVTCDGCDRVELITGMEFPQIVHQMKEKNWKIHKQIINTRHGTLDEWEHYCPVCRQMEGI